MSSNINSTHKRQPATCTFVVDYLSSGSYQASSPFSLPCDDSRSFLLCTNPSSTSYWQVTYVSISICLRESPNQGKVTVRYRVSIVDAKGQKCNTQEGIIKFIKIGQFGGHYILSRDVILDTANGWLVYGKLTLFCEVFLVDSELDESLKPSSMSHDYGSLFESGKLSDAVLVAGATEFKVHKTVLAARSAVFCAMFSHDTKESQENRIEVENVSAETYHELLRYIYTDKVDKMEENALELMVAADKYQLGHLKSACEQYLGSNVTIESVAVTLVMADMHRAEALKAKCFEYISKNGRDVKATEGWKTLSAKPELITEVLLYVIDKQNK